MSKYDNQRQPKKAPHVSLRVLRVVSGKTLDEICGLVSEELGVPFTRGSLSLVENGRRGASRQVLDALEVAYGLDPGSIVTDYEPRSRAVEQVPA